MIDVDVMVDDEMNNSWFERKKQSFCAKHKTL